MIDRLCKILAEISVIVRGPEPTGHRHGYADLPERVAALKAQSVVSQSLDLETALAESIDKIIPVLDSGDILADARQASAALAQPSAKSRNVNVGVRNAHAIADLLSGSDPNAGPIEAMHQCIDILATHVQQPRISASKDDLREVMREVAQDREDAERYRWLLDQSYFTGSAGWLKAVHVVRLDCDFFDIEEVKAAITAYIDAARAAKEE